MEPNLDLKEFFDFRWTGSSCQSLLVTTASAAFSSAVFSILTGWASFLSCAPISNLRALRLFPLRFLKLKLAGKPPEAILPPLGTCGVVNYVLKVMKPLCQCGVASHFIYFTKVLRIVINNARNQNYGKPHYNLKLMILSLLLTLVIGQLQDHLSFDTLHIPGVGSVRGIISRGEYRAFLAIPYAKPPIKTLRWRPPVPETKFQEIRDATKFGYVFVSVFM